MIIRFNHMHSHLSSDSDLSGPQKFHKLIVPRIGGIVDFVLSIASIAGGALFAPIIWSLFSKRQTPISVVTVTILTLVVNLFLKLGAPSLLDLKLNRTWETIIGQGFPLLILFFFEFYYRSKKMVYAFQEFHEVNDVQIDTNQIESDAQNIFGIRVISAAMAIVGIGITVLGFLSNTMNAVVATVGVIIFVIALIIGGLTFKAKSI